MSTVDIGIGHDDNLTIATFVKIKIECKKTAIVNVRKKPTAVNTCCIGKKSAGNIGIRTINVEDATPIVKQIQLKLFIQALSLNLVSLRR